MSRVQKTELYVLGIVGSPRKNGLTTQVVRKCLEGVAKAGLETKTLHLVDFHYQPCRDCHPTLACRETRSHDKCYHKDDFETVSSLIDGANGLVLGSAVYYGDVTNSVNTLFSKKVRHGKDRPKEGIPGIGIAVAGGMGGGYASALRRIYHFYRIIGILGMKPIPVTRFNLPMALDEAFQTGYDMALIIQKGEYITGPQRIASFLEFPILGFDYLQERQFLVRQIIEGARREKKSNESTERTANLYSRSENLGKSGDKAGALALVEDAYKAATSNWNPERQ